MGGAWASLNLAQRGALLVYAPVIAYLMWRVVSRALDRGWPLPLVLLAMVGVASLGGAALVLLLTTEA